VKRAVVLAVLGVLGVLAVAAPAYAGAPAVTGGSAIGRNQPMVAFGTLSPPVQLFGDPVTAKVAVVADTKWVDPANLRVLVHFAPYEPVAPPTRVQIGHGRVQQITWTWTLRCLTSKCVPATFSGPLSRVFHFGPARVEYLSPGGKIRYAFNARFQRIQVGSQLSPNIVRDVLKEETYKAWQFRLGPVPAPDYRLSPNLAYWLAIALACLLGAAGLALAARWALQFRSPALAQGPVLPDSPLERALTLFFWARANDDDTLQRKALERVADELPFDVHELSETAHTLAWSPETPGEDDVEAISEQAGVHRRNGEPTP
jgi:hypothetical protein